MLRNFHYKDIIIPATNRNQRAFGLRAVDALARRHPNHGWSETTLDSRTLAGRSVYGWRERRNVTIPVRAPSVVPVEDGNASASGRFR